MPSALRSLGPRVEAARKAVLDAARGAFGPGPMWQRTQRWLNAAHELIEAEAAAEAPTQRQVRPTEVPPFLPPPPPKRQGS